MEEAMMEAPTTVCPGTADTSSPNEAVDVGGYSLIVVGSAMRFVFAVIPLEDLPSVLRLPRRRT